MRRIVVSALLLAALLVTSILTAFAAPPIGNTPLQAPQDQDAQPRGDARAHPLGEAKAALRAQALEAKLQGKAQGKVHQVAQGQYVELERETEDPVLTVLGEFPNLAHNSIQQPDRSVDNTTIWTEDFSRDYYLDLLFAEGNGANSMRQFYIEQSSNRYTVYGDVLGWIQVPNAAATYDDDISGPAVWQFLIDSVNGWYNEQLAAGKTAAEIDAYLSTFDIWDRYDYDGDGDFNEPDGYIDHFQSVHAGEGNEAGGGVLGDAAIWSHSWFAYYNLTGAAGPDFNKDGGIQIGSSSYWIGDYTIQPENGGVGVFTHEYGHDLGLPDLYDTAGGENGTGFWTLMSSGSWMGDGTEDIGSKSSHMGAWEKFQLGWLNYEVAVAGQKSEHKLGPMEYNTKQAQALFVILPPKSVTVNIGAPRYGSYYYYSGSGDNLDNFMYKSFNLPAGAHLTARVRYQIESNWDYAYVVVSTDNGATWNSVPTNRSSATNPNGQNLGYGITGNGGSANNWLVLDADLSGYTGDVLVGFRYWTDVNTGGFGLMVDEISVAGSAPDGAEADAGWTFAGFRVTNGTEERQYSHYYVAEFRTYLGYDSTLKVGPYNFGFLNNPALQNWVEHLPYQDGLLINYWDTSQRNNNVAQHPGEGLILPIDAHPAAMIRADGGVWRNRMQSYDATFGKDKTDPLTLHWNSAPSYHPSLKAVDMFDDRITYYDPANPMGSVINPNTGTQVRIKSVSAQGTFMQVEVRPAK